MDAKKVKNLAGEHQQAEERIEKLVRYANYLGKGQCGISGIYIVSQVAAGVPIEITAGMDDEFIDNIYLMHILNGLNDEIASHEQRMKDIEQDIKKELLEEPTVNK